MGCFAFCSLSDAVDTVSANRPNVIIVQMDDLGTGQSQPYTESIGIDDMDPHLIDLVARPYRGFKPHTPEEGLEASQTAMPFLTRLADEGVRFDNAYTVNSLCAPSRQSLLSSLYPQRWGVIDNSDAAEIGLPQDQRCLPELFQEAGYATAVIGKWHVAQKDTSLRDKVLDEAGYRGSRHWMALRKENPELYQKAIAETGYCGASAYDQHPLRRGFDYYFGYNWSGSPYYNADNVWENDTFTGIRPDGEYNTELFTQKAAEFIDQAVSQKKPLFLYLNYHAVHGALNVNPPAKYMDKFNSSQPWVNSFYGHVNAVDEGIQTLFSALEKAGKAENTLFIFTSDNGASGNVFGAILPFNAPSKGCKGDGWLGGHRVPMIVWAPRLFKGGQVADELVSLMDIMPTALHAAGFHVPPNLDGRSLLPLLKGQQTGPVHNQLFMAGPHATSWGFPDAYSNPKDPLKAPLHASIRSGDWVYRIIGPTVPGLYPHLPNGKPRQVMLFNVKKDPGEKSNVVESQPEVARELDRQLSEWMSNTELPAHGDKARWQEVRQQNVRK